MNTFVNVLLCCVFALAPASLHAADTMPPTEVVLHAVETDAQTQHKSILLSFGASWCGNCHRFARFLSDPAIHPIIGKAFITSELITGERKDDPRHSNNPGGLAYEETLGGKGAGWPYLVILDPSGKLLVDSFRPDHGRPHALNIGYPASADEIDWFVHMLQVAGPGLTRSDLLTIRTWLTNHK